MKHTNFFSAILGTVVTSILGFGASAVAVPVVAAAGEATHCLIVRSGGLMGQELYNRCNGTVEATWCHYDENGCTRFNNSWTIRAGASYPIKSGRIRYGACEGANSLSSVGDGFECD